jgi:hypothetical protein
MPSDDLPQEELRDPQDEEYQELMDTIEELKKDNNKIHILLNELLSQQLNQHKKRIHIPLTEISFKKVST